MSNENKCVLELDMKRNIVGGSEQKLINAIKNGANLRIYTEFRHNEHIDTSAENNQLIKEVSDFPATYIIEDRWVAAIMTLRQPVSLPDRFGKRPSMSFFMYNQNGLQEIARPFLDNNGFEKTVGEPPADMFGSGKRQGVMKLMHNISDYATGTNAPASNFIYDFYSYKFLVSDDWTEVFAHDEEGNVTYGSSCALEEASAAGCDIKVGISGICEGVFGKEHTIKHELFIETGPHYYYTESELMIAETRPFVRVVPEIPMSYKEKNWDFGWAVVRSDGHVAGLWYDPYTLKYRRTYSKHAMRWFVRYK